MGIDPTQHISGQLREASDEILTENLTMSILLSEAAEKLDDAHEEWLTRMQREWLNQVATA